MKKRVVVQLDSNPLSESSDMTPSSPSILSSQDSDPLSPINTSKYYYFSFPVPLPKWIVVDNSVSPFCDAPVGSAVLIYHRASYTLGASH